MIRINLLPQRKSRSADRGQQTLLAGVGVALVAGAVVFFLVHSPLQAEIVTQEEKNAQMKQKNNKLRQETKDFEKLKSAFEAAEKQKATIDALQAARATPAWFLYELSNILTPDRQPTMTPEMARRVREDPNRAWDQGWDPKHVWITNFSESKGRFRLQGSAASDTDMTQFALRVQASNFFRNVVPQGGSEVSRKGGRPGFYRFTITGRVVY